jgi:hypothetical protein
MLRRSLFLILLATVTGCGAADDEVGSQQTDSTETFNRHLVLLDEQLADGDALSAAEIQAFVAHTPHGTRSVLADHVSNGRTAAEALAAAGSQYDINPLVLLTRLQLEQSLVSKTSATKKKLDWAMGCGCPDYQNCMEAYRGFDKQVECAAERLRTYLTQLDETGATIAGWKVGKGKKTLDGTTVTPKSRATAAIYTYTPWLSSAKNHVSIWKKYATFVGYQTPAPGDCDVVTYPSQVTIQLRPDDALSAEHNDEVSCFLDGDQLIAPDGITIYDASVKVSDHFRLSEFISVSSSRRLLLRPELVATLETMRVSLGSSISPRMAYQSPAALAAACQGCGDGDTCAGSCQTDELSRGTAALIESSAGPTALLQAAAQAGAPSCWAEGDWVYVGIDTALGCPRD